MKTVFHPITFHIIAWKQQYNLVLVEPVVQYDLYAISLRFRVRQYAIVADDEKKYRLIRLHRSDFPLHRIMW